MENPRNVHVEHLHARDFVDLAGFGYFLQLTNGRQLYNELHDHDFYELICVLSGACVHTLDGEVKRLSAGSMAFIRPGQTHSLTGQAVGTNVAALSFKRSEMSRFRAAFDPDRLPGTVALDIDTLHAIRHSCERIFVYQSGDPTLSLRALLGLLLSRLAEAETLADDAMPADFETLLVRMHSLGSASKGVPEFVRLSNFSYSQLRRLTLRYLGKTPGDYVTSLRLELAYDLIVWGNGGYEEIGDSVGFSSFSHFCKLIRETYGATPAKLRSSAKNRIRTV